MHDTSKTISDDFSDDGSPLSPREIPAGVNELPNDSKAAVYDPTSDKKPTANFDPLQRRASWDAASPEPKARDFGERLLDG
jgi:hypothetical protein